MWPVDEALKLKVAVWPRATLDSRQRELILGIDPHSHELLTNEASSI